MTELPLELFAVTAPGLEEVTAGELRDLRARRVTAVPGGVAFLGDLGMAFRANLWLRTATRVLLRLGHFEALGFGALVRGTEHVDWQGLLGAGAGTGLGVEVRVSCSHSRLGHSGAVAERVAGVLGAALGLGPAERMSADRYGAGLVSGPANHEIFVRLEHDHCTLSLDTSGEALHHRGYRLETAKAPLRETLAAALLRLAGWKGECPLVDPLAGSGTLPIEAALLAARIPPGAGRSFALERLPGFDLSLRAAALEEAAARRRPIEVPLWGADRDEGAVAVARRNAERAGLDSDMVRFECAPLGALCLTGERGLVVTNPPYGRRIGEVTALRDLYATLGAHLVAAPGWRLALVSTEPRLLGALGVPLSPLCPPVLHGGLRLHLVGGSDSWEPERLS